MTNGSDRTSAGIHLEPGEPTFFQFLAIHHREELKTMIRWYYSYLMRRRTAKRNKRNQT